VILIDFGSVLVGSFYLEAIDSEKMDGLEGDSLFSSFVVVSHP